MGRPPALPSRRRRARDGLRLWHRATAAVVVAAVAAAAPYVGVVATAAGRAAAPPPPLVGVPLGAVPLTAARAFAISRRPWARGLAPPPPRQRLVVLHVGSHSSDDDGGGSAGGGGSPDVDVPLRVGAPPPLRVTVVDAHATADSTHTTAERRASDGDGSAAAATLPSVPLRGDVVLMGEYFVALSVGSSPPRDVHVQVDTGSSTLALPLEACRTCRADARRLSVAPLPPPPAAAPPAGVVGGGGDLAAATVSAATAAAGPVSSLVACGSPVCGADTCDAYRVCRTCSVGRRACCAPDAPGACAFFLRYADESGARGALVTARVALANVSTVLTFGGILADTPDFERPLVDGILGLAYPPLACNPTCVRPLVDTLVADGRLVADAFGICTGRAGGTLTLGGADADQFKGDLRYVPLAPRHHHSPRLFYDVAVSGVTVGGVRVPVPDLATAIVDSGTTVVVLAPASFGALKAHFQTHYCHVPGLCPPGGKLRGGHPEATWFQPGYCATLTDADVAALPTLTFHLGSVPLSLEPSEYMLRFVAGRLVYRCLGITYLDGLQEQEAQAILGNVLLVKYYTLYDRAGDRVGFAPSTGCVRDGQSLAKLLADGAGADDNDWSDGGTGGGSDRRGGRISYGWVLVLVGGGALAAKLLADCMERRRQRSEYEPIGEPTT
ncbi:hypothetical protein MMPV_004970 [Pyropia vietnamensis]